MAALAGLPGLLARVDAGVLEGRRGRASRRPFCPPCSARYAATAPAHADHDRARRAPRSSRRSCRSGWGSSATSPHPLTVRARASRTMRRSAADGHELRRGPGHRRRRASRRVTWAPVGPDLHLRRVDSVRPAAEGRPRAVRDQPPAGGAGRSGGCEPVGRRRSWRRRRRRRARRRGPHRRRPRALTPRPDRSGSSRSRSSRDRIATSDWWPPRYQSFPRLLQAEQPDRRGQDDPPRVDAPNPTAKDWSQRTRRSSTAITTSAGLEQEERVHRVDVLVAGRPRGRRTADTEHRHCRQRARAHGHSAGIVDHAAGHVTRENGMIRRPTGPRRSASGSCAKPRRPRAAAT